jgi:hypothetical protein
MNHGVSYNCPSFSKLNGDVISFIVCVYIFSVCLMYGKYVTGRSRRVLTAIISQDKDLTMADQRFAFARKPKHPLPRFPTILF